MKIRAIGLYDPINEHDACGVGMVADISGRKDHQIIENGLKILENMAHRGAENADGMTGDGSGILVQIPHDFIVSQGISVPEAGRYGTGIIFLPMNDEVSKECMRAFRSECKCLDLSIIAERDVPVNHDSAGPIAREVEPRMVQVFITGSYNSDIFEQKLFRLRKKISNELTKLTDEFYICSLSSKCMVYKGMLTPMQLRKYYPDLSHPQFRSAVALVHSRFSTNTFPMWKLAQPFRMLCHNGEINTIRANRDWMAARESVMQSDRLPEMNELYPIIQGKMSDSASLDNVFEFLVRSGKTIPNALTMMIPESWNDKNPIPDELKAYYEYHSILMEPWDGPAAVLFTDGRYAGGMLDRNGLRPVRYTVTKDGMIVMASEAGVIKIDDENIESTGRLRPGKMLLIDLQENRIIQDDEIKNGLAKEYPYRKWLDKNRVEMESVSSGRKVERKIAGHKEFLQVFGYTKEDSDVIIGPMATNGSEPSGSMGNDTPLAILSEKPQRLFNYFRQMFAQVTNPPIDPIREELVMSLTGYVGSIHWNILDPMPELCKVVKLKHPIITDRELDLIRNLQYKGFKTVTVTMTFTREEGLENAIGRMCKMTENAVDEGAAYVILSDRSVDKYNIPIPSLLAVSAVHQYLSDKKKRIQTALIVESGEPREVMHFGLLFGYGANAVNPYMSYSLIDSMVLDGRLKIDIDTAERNYIKASEKGLMKIMSKMGISTLRSYRGAKLFEALGISNNVIDRYFRDTASNIGGLSLKNIEKETIDVHTHAFIEGDPSMEMDIGQYVYRGGGELHCWCPASIRALHKAVREKDNRSYQDFADLSDNKLYFIRDLMDLNGSPISLDEVESAESIMRRFVTGAMSFGSISKEAHETLAEAMNAIGGKSNTGEGGEDPARFKPYADGRNTRNAIKQIASGRFGVTTEYLVNADEIQIKIAQGAKPGEGGQLLGFKVDEVIAATRRTMPGITLISPPPHHDIYSIEDLKQLIFDMRCVNPSARISVKLVSENGVGTIAAGVVKAGADMVLISGSDGGTGASPLSSIRYAGLPWELGLAESQQTLVLNGLRERVRLQVDGQIKTGKDVVISALLGAEEYGFSTAPLIVMGCIMDRKCHTNMCPVGIATQNTDLRAKFKGTKEQLIQYFRFVAEDVRRHLAGLGLHSLDEAIGRSDLITQKITGVEKTDSVDISKIITKIPETKRFIRKYHDELETLDKKIIEDVFSSQNKTMDLHYSISNIDRSVGAMLSGEMVRKSSHKHTNVIFTGIAGQSFGAFLVDGLTFTLIGGANDYVAKGLDGGKIAILPSNEKVLENAIAGNTIAYGATSGELYIRGTVGERFCVRNSGAIAVAEGTGDHCCEYMTGGRTVILGNVGRNFAAGMSGGIAYVLNEDGMFDRHCNMDMVELSLLDEYDEKELHSIVESHLRYTGSPKARSILDGWEEHRSKFLKVLPIGYKGLLMKGKISK
ncbi:MAG: glutamate synthase large subunit [Candidatus Methanomethylophilaceae archaeon]|jgi:glutamate synthase (NADPH/NADH) large chain